jgi:hypothetical protein
MYDLHRSYNLVIAKIRMAANHYIINYSINTLYLIKRRWDLNMNEEPVLRYSKSIVDL